MGSDSGVPSLPELRYGELLTAGPDGTLVATRLVAGLSVSIQNRPIRGGRREIEISAGIAGQEEFAVQQVLAQLEAMQMLLRMTEHERAFVKACAERPDAANLNVFFGWLEDSGRPEALRRNSVRLCTEQRTVDVDAEDVAVVMRFAMGRTPFSDLTAMSEPTLRVASALAKLGVEV